MDFFTDRAAALLRREVLWLNPPWAIRVLQRAVAAALAREHRGAWLLVPARRTSRTTGYILSMWTGVIARRLPIPR